MHVLLSRGHQRVDLVQKQDAAALELGGQGEDAGQDLLALAVVLAGDGLDWDIDEWDHGHGGQSPRRARLPGSWGAVEEDRLGQPGGLKVLPGSRRDPV